MKATTVTSASQTTANMMPFTVGDSARVTDNPDHSGPSQPLEPDEPSQGLWLRLVNNSVLPIFMRVHSPLADPTMTILEDIVTPRIRTMPRTGFVDYGPMPHGYATASDVTSILTLNPGESVLFSVPVNHVAPGWFLQVAFQSINS